MSDDENNIYDRSPPNPVNRYLYGADASETVNDSTSSNQTTHYDNETTSPSIKPRSKSHDVLKANQVHESIIEEDAENKSAPFYRSRKKVIERGVSIKNFQNLVSSQNNKLANEKEELIELNSRLDRLVEAIKLKKSQNDDLELQIKEHRNYILNNRDGNKKQYSEDLDNAKKHLNQVSESSSVAKIRASRSLYDLHRLKEKYDEELRFQSNTREKINCLENQRTQSLHELRFLKENFESKFKSMQEDAIRNEKLREQIRQLMDSLDTEQSNRVDLECRIQTLMEQRKFEEELNGLLATEMQQLALYQGPNKLNDPASFYSNELREIKERIKEDFNKMNEYSFESMREEYERRSITVIEEMEQKRKQEELLREAVLQEEQANCMSLREEYSRNENEMLALREDECRLNKLLEELTSKYRHKKIVIEQANIEKDDQINCLHEHIKHLKTDLCSMLSASKSLDSEVAVYARLLNQRFYNYIESCNNSDITNSVVNTSKHPKSNFEIKHVSQIVLEQQKQQQPIHDIESDTIKIKLRELDEQKKLREQEEQRRLRELEEFKRRQIEEQQRREHEEQVRRQREMEEQRRLREQEEQRKRELEEQRREYEEQVRRQRELEEQRRLREQEEQRRRELEEQRRKEELHRREIEEFNRKQRELEEQKRLKELEDQRRKELEQQRKELEEQKRRQREIEELNRRQREIEEFNRRQRELEEQKRLRELEEQRKREQEDQKRKDAEEQKRRQREKEEQFKRQCELEEQKRLREMEEQRRREEIHLREIEEHRRFEEQQRREIEEQKRKQREIEEQNKRKAEEQKRREEHQRREIEEYSRRHQIIEEQNKPPRETYKREVEVIISQNNCHQKQTNEICEHERQERIKNQREEHEKYIIEKLRQEQEIIEIQKRKKLTQECQDIESQKRVVEQPKIKCIDNISSYTQHIIEENHKSSEFFEEHRIPVNVHLSKVKVGGDDSVQQRTISVAQHPPHPPIPPHPHPHHHHHHHHHDHHEKQINIRLMPLDKSRVSFNDHVCNQRNQSSFVDHCVSSNNGHKQVLIVNTYTRPKSLVSVRQNSCGTRSQSPPLARNVVKCKDDLVMTEIDKKPNNDISNKYAIKHKANRYVSGAIGILETSLNGEFIILENLSSNKTVNLKGWYIHRYVPDQNINVIYKFNEDCFLLNGEKLKIFSKCVDAKFSENTKSDEKKLVAENVKNWGKYSKFSVTKLINPEGVDKAVLTQSLLRLASSSTNVNKLCHSDVVANVKQISVDKNSEFIHPKDSCTSNEFNNNRQTVSTRSFVAPVTNTECTTTTSNTTSSMYLSNQIKTTTTLKKPVATSTATILNSSNSFNDMSSHQKQQATQSSFFTRQF